MAGGSFSVSSNSLAPGLGRKTAASLCPQLEAGGEHLPEPLRALSWWCQVSPPRNLSGQHVGTHSPDKQRLGPPRQSLLQGGRESHGVHLPLSMMGLVGLGPGVGGGARRSLLCISQSYRG